MWDQGIFSEREQMVSTAAETSFEALSPLIRARCWMVYRVEKANVFIDTTLDCRLS